MATIIRNPVEWTIDQVRAAAHHAGTIAQSLTGRDEADRPALPAVRQIGLDDIELSLRRGFEDFKAARSDVLALAAIYPMAGLVLWWTASNYNVLPLLFPLISGFALIGPVAAVGLYEMSRQREQGRTVSWADAFEVVRSPAFGSILVLGLALVAIFVAWLAAAEALYMAYLGPEQPASLTAMLTQVFTTSAGRSMAVMGIGLGLLFAVLVLTISAVSFPMLLDRNSGLNAAVVTSVRAVLANPVPMAIWGLIVAAGLVLGSLPLFVGLVVVVPVLGHATWHLYRRLVVR